MNYGVSFDPDALDQLMALERHLVRVAHPPVVDAYLTAVIAYCEGLGVLPHGGTSRSDLRPGLRTSSYKKGVPVAYVVDDRLRNVTVLGIFFGGQDFESLLEGE